MVADASDLALDDVVDAAFAGEPAERRTALQARPAAAGTASRHDHARGLATRRSLHRLRLTVDGGASVEHGDQRRAASAAFPQARAGRDGAQDLDQRAGSCASDAAIGHACLKAAANPTWPRRLTPARAGRHCGRRASPKDCVCWSDAPDHGARKRRTRQLTAPQRCAPAAARRRRAARASCTRMRTLAAAAAMLDLDREPERVGETLFQRDACRDPCGPGSSTLPFLPPASLCSWRTRLDLADIEPLADDLVRQLFRVRLADQRAGMAGGELARSGYRPSPCRAASAAAACSRHGCGSCRRSGRYRPGCADTASISAW